MTQEDLGRQLGLRSKGQISRLESGVGITTDIALNIERLTLGEIKASDLRPDLADVRIEQRPAAA